MKVMLSEEDAKALTHPEYAPHGVECEAEVRWCRKGDIAVQAGGPVTGHVSLGLCNEVAPAWWSGTARLVVTPRKPSLAQLVKDSGWRSPFATDTLRLHNGRWFMVGRELMPQARPKVAFTRDMDGIVRIDVHGHPIVEGGDA